MEVVFTICSNNYLAHAATLMQSWFEYHPHSTGYIILVDSVNENVDYSIINPASIILLSDLNIVSLPSLIEKYNITELNTAVKPDAFIHLFKKHSKSKIIYLDPDILVSGEFKEVFKSLDDNDFVLTPHICHPIDDDKAPTDYNTLRTGIFNLGFIALKDTSQVQVFLNWWRDRVFKYGYCDLPANMFYDQLWANFIPVFFDNYYIMKHPGYNMANWNLHERILSINEQNKWLVNKMFDLKFFHFSGYKFNKPDSIGSYHTRYDLISRPDLKSVFEIYHEKLESFGIASLSMIPCVYYEEHKRIKYDAQLARDKAIPEPSLKVKLLRKLASVARRIVYN